MAIRICSYNVEWFNRLFNKDNTLKTGASKQKRLGAIRDVLQTLQADLIGVVEAPNTSKDGSESTVLRLEAFARWAGLSTNKTMTGIISGGMQELAVLYNPAKVTVTHDRGGRKGSATNPPFDEEFRFDTDDDRIKEVYKFYRPPLEAKVEVGTGKDFKLMVVHPKSKGIFNAMDLAHWERESVRNRLKLFAECTWIRRRVDEWLKGRDEVIVMGDVNDGPGMDYYEMTYGRSAVEIIMGDLFTPERILRNYCGAPKWTADGWSPASARYKDRFTEDYVDVLIDHILVSKDIEPVPGDRPHRIWNPRQDEEAKAIRAALRAASDHFPVTLDLA